MNLIFKFNIEELEYDFIEVYKDDEDFNEEEKINEMWIEVESLFDEVDDFLIKYLGKSRVDELIMYGASDEKVVEGLSKEECELLLKNKKEIIYGYIIDIECNK